VPPTVRLTAASCSSAVGVYGNAQAATAASACTSTALKVPISRRTMPGGRPWCRIVAMNAWPALRVALFHRRQAIFKGNWFWNCRAGAVASGERFMSNVAWKTFANGACRPAQNQFCIPRRWVRSGLRVRIAVNGQCLATSARCNGPLENGGIIPASCNACMHACERQGHAQPLPNQQTTIPSPLAHHKDKPCRE